MQETWVWSLGQEDPLEKEMVTHSSILARRILWIEESGRLQSTGLQRVGHNWATNAHTHTHTHTHELSESVESRPGGESPFVSSATLRSEGFCPHPAKFLCWKPSAQGWWHQEVGYLGGDWSPYWRDLAALALPSHHMRIQWERSLQPGGGSPSALWTPWSQRSSLQDCEKQAAVVDKPPVCGILLQLPQQIYSLLCSLLVAGLSPSSRSKHFKNPVRCCICDFMR